MDEFFGEMNIGLRTKYPQFKFDVKPVRLPTSLLPTWSDFVLNTSVATVA